MTFYRTKNNMLENAKDRYTDMQSTFLSYVHIYIQYIMRQANHVRAGLLAGWHAGRHTGRQAGRLITLLPPKKP